MESSKLSLSTTVCDRGVPFAFAPYAEVSKKDYRGYYGLGQAYELMKVPNLALYFYMRAHKLK